ncbi:MAG: rhomboid family intrarane serine protease [Paenibacillaceae bacterium]|jgi:rhomboid protease GluP|nr:rhomboid family intrarane serine protease [Paenibacillaceae bacterium]
MDTAISLVMSPINMKLLTGFVFGGYGPLAASLSLNYDGLIHHEYWRLFTYGLGHTGILHLYFNIWAIHWIGKAVEKKIGCWWTFSILLTSYVVNGCIFAGLFKPQLSFSPSVGTFALVGMWLFFKFAHKQKIVFSQQEKYALIILAATNFLGADTLFVHGAGFAVGIAAGWIYSTLATPPSQKNRATPQ